jgi:hypothetical protein
MEWIRKFWVTLREKLDGKKLENKFLEKELEYNIC